MRTIISLAALALFLGPSLPGIAVAREAADLAEDDFRSQTPPDYAALERLQRANLGLPAIDRSPSPATRHRVHGRRPR